MPQVTLKIYLRKDDKERPEVIGLLVRESGDTKEEMTSFLASNDVITVEDLELERANELVDKCTGVGISAAIVPTDEAAGGQAPQWMDDFKHSWNWWAFLFTFLWYAVKGLWIKLSVYIMVEWLINHLPLPLLLSIVLHFAFWIYIGMFANYDYHLKHERGERLWPQVPFKKWKKRYIIGCVVFILVAILIPFTRFVGTMLYSMRSFMELEDGAVEQVEVTKGVSFTRVPRTWWKFVKPPSGMSIKAERERGDVDETIEYVSNKHTKMMAIVGTAAALDGMTNESLGVIAVELYKPGLFKKYEVVDDFKLAKEITERHTLKLPFGLKWLDKFFSVVPSEPTYRTLGRYKWGRVVIARKIQIAGHEIEAFSDVYWTVVNAQLVTVQIDCFPEHLERVRAHAHDFMKSLRTGGEAPASPVPAAAVVKKENVPPVVVKKIATKEETVADLVALGMMFLEKNDTDKAQQCLDKAIKKAQNEADMRSIERLRDKMHGKYYVE